jgi:hypothetical protein
MSDTDINVTEYIGQNGIRSSYSNDIQGGH